MKTGNDHRHPILVVEDDEDMRENLRRLLSGAGYDVQLASNGVEALTALSAQPCHLVLTDLIMPDMGGLELLKVIRQHNRHLPVVFLTALGDRATYDRITQMGAADFVPKPFRGYVLLALVHRILVERTHDAEGRPGT